MATFGYNSNSLTLGESIIAFFVLALCLFGIARCSAKLDALNEDGQRYVAKYHCVPDGFVGKNATPIYRCETGVYKVGKINKMGKDLKS